MRSSPTSTETLPSFADVEAAYRRLQPVAVRTPLLESPTLNALAGVRVLVKAEPLQRTGSFKFRGAFNRLSALSAEERARGVVAYSSGNHAQGVAAAAADLGVAATIVMPEDAPQVKFDGVHALGATIVSYDRNTEDREAITRAIAERDGAAIVPPYDDPLIIAGQGTVGLEITQQAAELDVTPDAVVVPCGGGGLISGCALALRAAWPEIPVYAVEPAGFDDTGRSLRAGERVENAPGATSLCDALLVQTPGALTFALNQRLLAGGVAVGDDAVMAAMAAAARHLKLVVEPGGAVALAAVLSGKLAVKARTVAVVCSGGNADMRMVTRALSQPSD